MTCATVRNLIVAGDERALSSAEATAIASHLGECERCRAFEAMGPRDLARFRAEVPLAGADYARIRARVRETVRERRTLFVPRFAVALAATVLVATAGWLATRQPPPVIAPSQPVAAADVPERPVATTRPTTPATSPVARAEVTAAPPRVAAGSGTPRAETEVRSPAPAVSVPATSPSQVPPVFIEIHTADPDIRILWIAGSESADDPTTSMEE